MYTPTQPAPGSAPADARQIPCRQGIFRENPGNALRIRNSIESGREFLRRLQGIYCGGAGNFAYRVGNYRISEQLIIKQVIVII
ncbi:MAG: hypothetical protein WA459_19860 [Stellaceae bacterium]